MGLKHFHLFFIACSLGLMGVVMSWARQQSSAGSMAAAAVGTALGLAYLGWFVRKYRTLA